MADENERIEAYLRRDESLIGRVVNRVADGWRTLTGNTPSWVLAADKAADIESGKAAAEIAQHDALALTEHQAWEDFNANVERTALEREEEYQAWEDLEAADDLAEQEARDDYERSQGRDPDAPWPEEIAIDANILDNARRQVLDRAAAVDRIVLDDLVNREVSEERLADARKVVSLQHARQERVDPGKPNRQREAAENER